jgi:hypothetical protein
VQHQSQNITHAGTNICRNNQYGYNQDPLLSAAFSETNVCEICKGKMTCTSQMTHSK